MGARWPGIGQWQKVNMQLRQIRIYLSIGYQSLKYMVLHHPPFKKPVARLTGQSESVPSESPERTHLLFRHYVRQFNDAACSVATMATILNAALEMRDGAHPSPLDQPEILTRVEVADWKARIMPADGSSKRGMPLNELGKAVSHSLTAYGFTWTAMDVVALGENNTDISTQKAQLLDHLISFEHSRDQFFIAHFNQGIFLKGLHLPHISPVGAFNRETGEVLVLDVDRHGPGPYWVPFDTFFKGLKSDFNGGLRRYGYGSGGYIRFKLTMPAGKEKGIERHCDAVRCDGPKGEGR